MKTAATLIDKCRTRRVSITLYEEDLVLVGLLQMYTGIRNRSAVIRLALCELNARYRAANAKGMTFANTREGMDDAAASTE